MCAVADAAGHHRAIFNNINTLESLFDLPVSDSVIVTALATAFTTFSDGMMGAKSMSEQVSTVAVKIWIVI